jgi:hypothetical protein
MVKLLTFFFITLAIASIVKAPYIAAAFYMGVSLLQPQYVWFWAFDGISIFKISAGIAILAWLIQVVRNKVNWQVYNNGIFYGMLLLLIVFQLSEFFTPFPRYLSNVSSTIILDIFTTIFIMFFITLGLINDQRGLKLLILVLVAVTIYYTYWVNSAYFLAEWQRFEQGRLPGPEGSPYRDGNIFSVLFVITLPFILFAIHQVDKLWQKVLLALLIVFMWHSLILFASRGAMLAAGVSMIVAAFMIKSKPFNIFLIIGFIIFVIDQGGSVLSRSVETIQRVETRALEPINPRIVSWTVGIELIQKHPFLGVGPQRFLEASSFYFPGRSPHVAHNTFLNFTANTGIFAGAIYLSFFWYARKLYKANKRYLKIQPSDFGTYINKAGITAVIGFFTAALFLDLIIFEPFYFLLLVLVLNHSLLSARKQEPEKNNNSVDNQINQKFNPAFVTK